MKYNEFGFLEEKIKEIKKENRERRKWINWCYNTYYNRVRLTEIERKRLLENAEIGRIMIKHNLNILKEYEEMLKEAKGVRK